MNIDSTLTPTSRRAHKSDRDENLKWLGFVAIIVAIYFCAQAIGTALAAARSSIAELPLPILLGLFASVMLIRRLVPPVWYTVPTGAVMVVVLVDKLGLLAGVLAFQSLKLLDLLSVYFVHRMYGPFLLRHLEVGAYSEQQQQQQQQQHQQQPPPSLWWLPGTLVQAIRVIDGEWGHRLQTMAPWGQPAFVCAFGVSWCMDEEAMLFWFALRSRVGALPFSAGLVSYTFLNVPDMLVRARMFAAAIDATAESNASLFWDMVKDTSIQIIVVMLIIAAPATLYVHGTHVRLLSEGFCFVKLTIISL
jgi:hypothetical protein